MKRAVLVLLGGCQAVFPLEGPPPIEPPTDCSKLRLFADDFNDGGLPPWSNTRTDKAFVIVGGQLIGDVDNSAVEARPEPFFELRTSSFQVEVTRSTADPGGSGIIALELLPDPDRPVDAIAMRLTGNVVEAGTMTNNTFQSQRSIAHDMAKPVLRISYDDGTAHFAVGDGVVFDEFHTLDIPLTFVRPHLIGQMGVPGNFQVKFDDVNGGQPEGDACQVTALTDKFAGAELDLSRWGRSETVNCKLAQADGITMTNDGSNWHCTLGGTTVYDLLDHTLEIEVAFDPPLVFPPNGNLGVEARLEVTTPGLLRGGLRLQGNGQLASFENLVPLNPPSTPAESTNLLARPYDPGQHRIWRIGATRDAFGDQLVFETSADGTKFDSFFQTGNLRGLDQAVVSVVFEGVNPFEPVLRVDHVTVRPVAN